MSGLLLAGLVAYAPPTPVYHVKSPDGKLDLTVQPLALPEGT